MRALIDTGPWIAMIDRSESRHEKCVDWLSQFEGEVFSSEAVLTEVLYLLNFSSAAQSAAIDFVLEGAISLVPSSIESLKVVRRLMKKYQDLPMDFADGTLVSIAQDFAIYNVVTFDKEHFGIYRIGRKPFFMVLT